MSLSDPTVDALVSQVLQAVIHPTHATGFAVVARASDAVAAGLAAQPALQAEP